MVMFDGKATGCVLDVASQVGGVSPGTATLLDRSRFKNNGTMTNVTWTRLPSGLWVMSFDGSAGVTKALTLSFDAITLLAWFKSSGAPVNYQTLISLNRDATHGAVMIYRAASEAIYGYISNSGSSQSVSIPFNWTSNTLWHCVSVTVSGALLTLGLDGMTVDGPDVQTLVPAIAVSINLGYYSAASKYSGQLALAKVYNFALTPAQIRNIYARERGYFGV